MSSRPMVLIESPYAGDVEANVAYARRAMADCIRRGESPYAGHLLFTQPGILNDLNVAQRKLGIELGFQWGARADIVAFYTGRGTSKGMRAALEYWREFNAMTDNPIDIQMRLIGEIDRDDRLGKSSDGGVA